jgi:hypothetical protein
MVVWSNMRFMHVKVRNNFYLIHRSLKKNFLKDMKKTNEEPDPDGTYEKAVHNPSKDYLVSEIPLLTLKRDS